MVVLVYIDDLWIIGSSSQFIQSLITQINSQFNLKDLRALNYLLGIKVTFQGDIVYINQKKYI